jgi:hypothetical protein
MFIQEKLNGPNTRRARDKIKVDNLIMRLQKHVELEVEYKDGYPIYPKGFMHTAQIQAAKLLLDKALSNAPTEVNANVAAGITFVLDKADVNI